MSEPRPRSGWYEPIEPGIRRYHVVSCRSSADRKPGRRCDCPSWQINVPTGEPGGTKWHTLTGVTRAEVRRERHRLMGPDRPAAAPLTSPEPDRPELFFDFAKQYFRAKQSTLAPSTFEDYEDEYRRRIHPALGHLPMPEITRRRCETWHTDLIHVAKSPRMVNTSVAVLRAMLTTAVEWGLLPSNPASRLKRQPDDPDRVGARRVLDAEQLDRLLTGLSPCHETMLRAASEGGLRCSEIVGLKWPDIRLAERRIDVRRGRNGRPTKNLRARTIHISEAYTARLVAWYSESVVEGSADAKGHVWPGRNGNEMSRQTPTQICRRAQIKAGLTNDEDDPLITLHGLRHTCASLLFAKGTPSLVVSLHLGHSSLLVTAEVYAHLINDAQMDAVADVFDGLDRGRTLRDDVAAYS